MQQIYYSMKLTVLSEDIRYSEGNREVYKITTSILDLIINKVPGVSCTIYSADEERCEASIRYGEEYNKLLNKRHWRFSMKILVSLSKQYVYIHGTNIRFPFSPEMPELVATTIFKYLMLA